MHKVTQSDLPKQNLILPAMKSEQPAFTVHQLTVFRIVASCLSYTQAAELLYLSQPAVSQQIKTLELTLGLRLFVRKGRGIVLTQAGHELLIHAERLLTLFAETETVVQENSHSPTGKYPGRCWYQCWHLRSSSITGYFLYPLSTNPCYTHSSEPSFH